MADYRAEYRNWCDNTYFDEDTRREVKELTSEEEIKDRFYKELEFGTGGLRGIMGAGLNRMNRYKMCIRDRLFPMRFQVLQQRR